MARPVRAIIWPAERGKDIYTCIHHRRTLSSHIDEKFRADEAISQNAPRPAYPKSALAGLRGGRVPAEC